MPQLRYLMRVASGMSLGKMKAVLDFCHEKSGKPRAWLAADIVWCMIRYGAGYYDYKIFAFYDVPRRNRWTYVTRMKNKRMINQLNDERFNPQLDNKSIFAKRFAPYLHREVLVLTDMTLQRLAEFVADKPVIYAKPSCGWSGKGIEKLTVADFADVTALYAYLTDPAKNFGLIEQLIVQHPAVAAVYPLAVNTIRIVSVVDADRTPHIIYSTMKFGDRGHFVDNVENDGMCIPVDPERGCLTGVAHTSRLEVLDRHPMTGVVFDGFPVPFIAEAHELVKKAALVIPEMRYSGWDVAITETGPAIVEGNDYPGYDFWQLPEQTPDRIGLVPTYRKLGIRI